MATKPDPDYSASARIIGDRVRSVRETIAREAQHAGRPASDVCLVAVTKTFPPSLIQSALAAGLRVFGENRVQEAAKKWPEIRAAQAGVELHLLGPLQTNKVREAVALFDVIHSLDREKLALKLRDIIDKSSSAKTSPRLYVQVNTGEEQQKSGVLPEEADDFIAFCRRELRLNVQGLMCIPPREEPAGLHFALLRQIAARNALPHLSMGMSEDFATAVRLGSTHVRLGTALFGPRPAKPGGTGSSVSTGSSGPSLSSGSSLSSGA